MPVKDDLTYFWANCYGMSAKNYKVLFCLDIVRESGMRALFDKIENDIIENEISLLLIEVSSYIIDPHTIYDLKEKYGLMVLLLAPDDEFKFDWISSTYATVADLVLTSDYVSVNRYRQSGVNAHFFPLPVFIPAKLNAYNISKQHDVSFVGRVDQGRIRNKFREYIDLPVHNFNISWLVNKGRNDPSFLSQEEMYSVFRNSSINLNFTGVTVFSKNNNPLFERIRGMKLRPFEIAVSGGFCISEYSISLAKCFTDGVDIVFCSNKEEMADKIKYYLAHQDEAKRIALAGSKMIEKKFSSKAVASKLTKLIQETQEHKGVDLYGEPQRVQVSKLFAACFIEFKLSNGIILLFKGRFFSFFYDYLDLVKFIRRLSTNHGLFSTLQVVIFSFYRLGKSILAKIKFLNALSYLKKVLKQNNSKKVE